jgi:hypothetical protein
MSPELERLLAALYEYNTCEPVDLPKWEATVSRLIDDALQKQPGLTRDEFMEALRDRYREFCRARRKPPTLPPKA